MRDWIFCYGSLQADDFAARLVGYRMPSVRAYLPDHRVARLPGRRYPGIWPAPHHTAQGCCYALRRARDLQRLDRYEGPGYRRQRRLVTTAAGETRLAWVYLPLAGRFGARHAWSAELFIRRHFRRHLRAALRWRAPRVAAPTTGDA